MKVLEKILNESEEKLISEIVDSEYWPIMVKLWDSDELNIMKTVMTSNYGDEFHFYKGQLAHVKKEKKRFLDIKKRVLSRKAKDASKK